MTVALFLITAQQSTDAHMQTRSWCQKKDENKKHMLMVSVVKEAETLQGVHLVCFFFLFLSFINPCAKSKQSNCFTRSERTSFQTCDLDCHKVWFYVALLLGGWGWRKQHELILCVSVRGRMCVCA